MEDILAFELIKHGVFGVGTGRFLGNEVGGCWWRRCCCARGMYNCGGGSGRSIAAVHGVARSLTSWGVEEDFTELGEMGEAAAVCVDGETRAGGRIWLCGIGCVAVAPAGLAVLP